jgi:hypothetical protein
MAGKGSHGRIAIRTEVRGVGGGGGGGLGCFRNSAYMEFRMFFLIPYILYSIRNCHKFRGSPYYGICQILRNSATFGAIKFHIILTSGG